MATVLTRDRVGRLPLRVGRVLLVVLAAVLYAVGWVAASAVRVLWLGLSWSVAAVQVGWHDAHTPGPSGRG